MKELLNKRNIKALALSSFTAIGISISGCSYSPEVTYGEGTTDPLTNLFSSFSSNDVKSDDKKQSQTDSLIQAQQMLEASVEEIPTLTAVGYAVVSTQPGHSDAQRRLMAIRAARMAATQLVANNSLVQLLGTQENQARAACMEYECNQGNHTMFGLPEDTVYRAYEPWRNLYR